jgi:phospholipid transport system substrate-binding protein
MGTRHFIHALAVLLLVSPLCPLRAGDPPVAGQSAFVSELAQQALLSVSGDTVSAEDRRHRLQDFLLKDFDMPKISSFVLGRYWQKATDTERQMFTAAYSDFLVRIYSQRFTRYSGESFRVLGQQAESATSTLVVTEMTSPSSAQPLKVEWRVVDSDGYRITDISVAGVSMALTQREDFRSILQQNGGNLSILTQRLNEKLASQDAH